MQIEIIFESIQRNPRGWWVDRREVFNWRLYVFPLFQNEENETCTLICQPACNKKINAEQGQNVTLFIISLKPGFKSKGNFGVKLQQTITAENI